MCLSIFLPLSLCMCLSLFRFLVRLHRYMPACTQSSGLLVLRLSLCSLCRLPYPTLAALCFSWKFNDATEITVSELARGINVSNTEIVRHLFPLVRARCLLAPVICWHRCCARYPSRPARSSVTPSAGSVWMTTKRVVQV